MGLQTSDVGEYFLTNMAAGKNGKTVKIKICVN